MGELREGEIWVGNTDAGKVDDYLIELKTIRLGEVAYDINGKRLDPDYIRPLIVHRSEYDKYNKIMEERFKEICR